MKLYFAPGACSLSPHIALREAGLEFELKQIDMASHKVKDSGQDYYQINPKGYVPALELDNGVVLTEGPAIVQYVADQKPESGLAPQNGTIARYQLQEMLHFIGTEIHKSFSPLWSPATSDEVKQGNRQRIEGRFDHMNRLLEGHPFLLGDQFTVADGYLFVMLNWAKFMKFDLDRWPNLTAFHGRVASRPAVQAAMKAEGLLR